MRINAILNDDGTAACSYGEPGNMAGFEVDYARAELRLVAADGSLVRSIVHTPGGQTVVGGPDPAPPASVAGQGNGVAAAEVEVQAKPSPSEANPAAVEAHVDEVKP